MYKASDPFSIEEFNLNSDYYIRFNLNSVSFVDTELSERFTILEKFDDNILTTLMEETTKLMLLIYSLIEVQLKIQITVVELHTI
jgi:hypothetical protein